LDLNKEMAHNGSIDGYFKRSKWRHLKPLLTGVVIGAVIMSLCSCNAPDAPLNEANGLADFYDDEDLLEARQKWAAATGDRALRVLMNDLQTKHNLTHFVPRESDLLGMRGENHVVLEIQQRYEGKYTVKVIK